MSALRVNAMAGSAVDMDVGQFGQEAAVRDAGFEALFHEEYDRCASVASRICGSPALGEEVAMDAFARAWASWQRISRYRRPAAWLMRVTVNCAIDVARRATPEPTATVVPDISHAVVSTAVLAEAFRSLSTRQRDAVALRYLVGLPEREVALRLGVSTGSVKTHTHRGLARLREALGTEDDGGAIDARS